MPEIELARRDGVELIRTGTWGASTGSWTPTRKDILAAVEAMKCPAVGKPILTIGHVDKRFTPRSDGDGQPGIGWVDNLRAGEDGDLLLGDYVGVPAWIDQIMASAWPKRSIEGKYNYRCALNHRHDFALDAVSLLGTTAPAIPTLRSLNDVAELYGVEIAASEDHTGDSVYAIVAAAEVHSGAMVALIPTAQHAERLAVEGGEPAGELHLTLAYLGEAADLGDAGQQDVIDAVSTAANGLPLLDAEVFAVSAFNPGDTSGRDTCLVYGLSGDMLDAVHDLIDDALFGGFVDAPIPSQHRPWNAHITAEYTGDLSRIAALAGNVGPVRFDRLRLAFGDDHIDIPLIEWAADEGGDEPDVAATAGDSDRLHDYWTRGAGLAKWRTKPHPWTALFNHLKKFLSAERAKRTASKWFLEVMGHTPNQVKASVHSWDEGKHQRDGDGQFSHTAGSASSGAERKSRDGLKVGKRISLADGETLVSSGKVSGGKTSTANTLMAVVDGKSGPTLRFGVVSRGDQGDWDGKSGATVTLGEAGIGDLWDATSVLGDEITKRSADYKQAVKSHKAKVQELLADAEGKQGGDRKAALEHAEQVDRDEAPDFEYDGPEQSIPAADGGAVVYKLTASGGDKGTVEGLHGFDYEGQQWEVDVAVKPPGAGDDWSLFQEVGAEQHTSWEPKQLADMAKMLDRLTVGEADRDTVKASLRWRHDRDRIRRVVASAPDHAALFAADLARVEERILASSPVLPAAEPEQVINPDPNEEDFVSTELSGLRSRLGLSDDADLDAITAKVDELKAQAEKTPEPTPEMVAASAAAVELASKAEQEKDELRKEVQVLASQMETISTELAATKKREADTVKASVFDAAIKDGKLKPADREQWEADYDEAPAAITRVLASIAAGTAVPVLASGTVGDPEPSFDDDFEAMIARIDSPTGKAV